MNRHLLYVISLFLLANEASANVVWPALFVETKYTSFYIIAINLCIEYPFIRLTYKQNWRRSLLFLLIGNLASCTIGIIARPLSGIAWELFPMSIVNMVLGWGTFNPVTWASTVVLGGIVNAILETVPIKYIFKCKMTWGMWWLIALANMISLAIALVLAFAYPVKM